MSNEALTIRKALDISSAGPYLIPAEIIDGAIRDYVSLEPVLYNAFPKQPWATNTYFIRKRTANPTATWSTDGAAMVDATNSTFGKVSKAIKYLYTRGEVTGPMQRAAGSLFNTLAMEVEAHSRAMVENLSYNIAVGDDDDNEIEGIIYQSEAPGNNLNASSVTAGFGLADAQGGLFASGAALSLTNLDAAIDNSRGEVDLIVTSRKVRRKLASLLQAVQRFNDTIEVNAGFKVLSYDGIPIVTDLHWETNSDILLVRRADCKILVHQDFTYEDLAKTKDSNDFFIKWYGGFAVEGRPTHYTFTGV